MKLALCILAAFIASACAQYEQQQPVAQAPPPQPAPGPAPMPGGAPVPPVGPGVPPVGPGIPPFGPGIPPMGIGLPPVFPGVFPGLLGMGLGLPFLGLGGLGLGLGGLGLGLGGLGFRGGLLGGGLGLRGGMFNRIRGKREADESEIENKIRCILSLETNILNCTGPHEIYECKVQPHKVTVPSTKSILYGLQFKEHKQRRHVKKSTEVLRLVSRKSSKFTFVDAATHSTVLLSVYGDKKVTEPGFLVKDPECFQDILNLYKTHRDNLLVALNAN